MAEFIIGEPVFGCGQFFKKTKQLMMMKKLSKQDKYEELTVEIQELKEFKSIHKGKNIDLGSGKSVLDIHSKMWNKWVDSQILKLTKQRLKYA